MAETNGDAMLYVIHNVRFSSVVMTPGATDRCWTRRVLVLGLGSGHGTAGLGSVRTGTAISSRFESGMRTDSATIGMKKLAQMQRLACGGVINNNPLSGKLKCPTSLYLCSLPIGSTVCVSALDGGAGDIRTVYS